MSFLDKFFSKTKQKTPAELAKERLLRIVVESRGMRGAPDFIPRMKEEILQVIRKYVTIEDEQVKVDVRKEEDCTMLGLEINLNKDQLANKKAD